MRAVTTESPEAAASPVAGRQHNPHPQAAFGRCGMGRGKVAFLALVLLAGACVDKKQQQCDPASDDSCSLGTGPARCTRDADCGDGTCQSDGTCKAKDTAPQATACANVSCPAGDFCSNGQCIPASPQCKQADPACIFIPHGAFETPAREWWWPWLTPDG